MVNKVKNFLIVFLKLLDCANTFKTVSKRSIQETTEVTGDLIGNKTAGKITRIEWQNPSSESETPMQTENINEIPREIYTPPEKRQKIIDELRLI